MNGLDRQIYAFCVVVLTGVAVGLLFDLLRVGRKRLARRSPAATLADLLFCLAAATVVLAAFILGNWDGLRLWMFLALAAGLLGYGALAGPVLLPVFSAVLDLVLWPWLTLGRCWQRYKGGPRRR